MALVKYIAVHTLVVDGPKGADGKPGKPVEVAAGRTFETENTVLADSLLAQGAIREANPKRKIKLAADDDGNVVSPSGYAPGTAGDRAVVSDPNAPDAGGKKEDLSSITDGAASDAAAADAAAAAAETADAKGDSKADTKSGGKK